VCGGKPPIAGRRIRVQDIGAWYEYHGMTPDEIVSGYRPITLSDVHAALAYYHAHRDEIQRQMKGDEEFIDNLRRTDTQSSHQPADADAHGHSL
jgi:uncharacterized protein (DUF433 family)